jgi:uncharacterized membrane protein
MKREGKLMRGMLLGAGAMYLLDPDRGARRRSLLRDQLVHAGHKLGDGMAATARDTRNRAAGVAAELKARLHEDEVDDTVLHERVRSAIGRAVSHPGSISVTTFEGQVTLSGQVLADEVGDLMRQVEQVRGVREVRNQLEMYRSSEGVSSLQGSGRRPDQRSAMPNWRPAVRLAVGALGGLLAVKGLRRTGLRGNALTAAGAGLLSRAITNRSSRGVFAGATGAQDIQIQKTIRVNAPLEQVWELWSNFENLPRFMTHLREVRRTYKNRSHWVAAGPAGIPVEWDAVVTEWVPNECIAWSSVEGSMVDTAGRVSFAQMPEGTIQIDVNMSYTPPAGAVGHAVAALFGTDPKRAMDEDMVRFKSLLEQGKTTAESKPVHLEEVIPGSAAGRAKRR